MSITLEPGRPYLQVCSHFEGPQSPRASSCGGPEPGWSVAQLSLQGFSDSLLYKEIHLLVVSDVSIFADCFWKISGKKGQVGAKY